MNKMEQIREYLSGLPPEWEARVWDTGLQVPLRRRGAARRNAGAKPWLAVRLSLFTRIPFARLDGLPIGKLQTFWDNAWPSFCLLNGGIDRVFPLMNALSEVLAQEPVAHQSELVS